MQKKIQNKTRKLKVTILDEKNEKFSNAPPSPTPTASLKEKRSNNLITHITTKSKQDEKKNTQSSKANKFLTFCKQYGFVGFSFPKIKTQAHEKNGKYKKFPQHMPAWKDFDRKSNATQIESSHCAFAIVTGSNSNLTVIDCDSTESYHAITHDYPVLLDALTIASPRGFHIYCQYEQGIKSNSQSFSSYPDVDIRNDAAIIFAPPTSYVNCLTKGVENYTILNDDKTELAYFPSALKKDLKCCRSRNAFKQISIDPSWPLATISSNAEGDEFSDSDSSVDQMPMLSEEVDEEEAHVQRQVVSKSEGENDDYGNQLGQERRRIPPSEQEIVDLLNVLPNTHFNGWNAWFKIGAILFNELGDTHHSKDLFLHHSRRAPLYAEKVSMLDIDVVWRRYQNKKEGTGNVTIATLYSWCKNIDKKRFRKIQQKHQAFDFNLITTTNIAKFFVKLYGDDFIQSNDNLYFWDENIWNKRLARQQMMKMIGNHLHDDLLYQAQLHHKRNAEALKLVVESLKSIQHRPYKENIMKDILTEMPQNGEIEFDINAAQVDNIHFQNGVLMLNKVKLLNKKGIIPEKRKLNETHALPSISIDSAFRERTKEDYVSQVLPYNFQKPTDEHIEKVFQIFRQIQPDQQQRDFQLGWSAYTMTGRTSEQKFKMNIGYTAANGKSTELKIHEASLSIYTMKLDKRTFNEGNTKQHKQFIHLIQNPIRSAYIEEMDRRRLDADLLKDFVDGHKLNVEIMYGTSVAKSIQAKFSACSNKDLNVDADRGILRRGLVQQYTSQFVAHPDPNIPYQFALCRDTEKCFQTDDHYKCAYVWVLLPYIARYYEKGGVLDIPIFAQEQFRAIAEEYDSYKNALMEICIPGTKEDRIYKGDLLQEMQEKLGRRNLTFNQLLVELKRLGYTYERQQRVKSILNTSTSQKGAICGLKWNPDTILGKNLFHCEEKDDDDGC